jgi:hypothetical protein
MTAPAARGAAAGRWGATAGRWGARAPLLVGALLAAVSGGTGVSWAAQRPYTVRAGGYRANPRFAVSYRGSGRWATTYSSVSPNPGGKPDHNHAHDTSTQSWAFSYGQLTVPRCPSGPVRTSDSACRRTSSLTATAGTSSAAATIDHVHVDGLYAFDNASLKCTQHVATIRGQRLIEAIQVRYEPGPNALAITALDPVSDALTILPTECPGQGDPIDGLANTYATPGFSFSLDYGPDRWFTSRTTLIPLRVLHGSSRVTIRLHPTRQGTPPRHCVRAHPSYERCTTGGSWRGTLMLRRR